MESDTARLDKCGLNHTRNARFYVSAMPCLIHEAEDIGGQGAKMVINSLAIIGVIGAVVALIAAFRWGQECGYDDGYMDGRKAVRAYYESLIK